MREIKFRAWNKKRKRMYEVLHLHQPNYDEHMTWATVKGYSIIEQKDIHIDIQPKNIILMQYTGYHSKDGKKIYENDIVLDSYGNTYLMNMKLTLEDNSVRIIGNKIENPELVGGQK